MWGVLRVQLVLPNASPPVNHQHTSPGKTPRSLLWHYVGLIHSLSSGPWAYPWQKEAGGGAVFVWKLPPLPIFIILFP